MQRGLARRALTAGAALCLTALFSTCKLDDLVVPPTVKVLSVAPQTAGDSAAAGSTALHTASITLSSSRAGEELSWTAARALNSAWLALNPSSGNTPSTISITTDPSGLARGLYRDTLVLTAAGATSIRVPVEFKIHDDAGIHTFQDGVSFLAGGEQTLTASDLLNGVAGSATVYVDGLLGPAPPSPQAVSYIVNP